MKAGQTTYADVTAQLGPPTSVSTKSDGTKIAVYYSIHAQARPASFIPVVGLFAGGADSRSSSVVFRFDAASKLIDFTSSQTGVGASNGTATAAPAQPATTGN